MCIALNIERWREIENDRIKAWNIYHEHEVLELWLLLKKLIINVHNLIFYCSQVTAHLIIIFYRSFDYSYSSFYNFPKIEQSDKLLLNKSLVSN